MYADGVTEEQMNHRQEVMYHANKCGCTLTGKPDGTEPVTVVFNPNQWCEFIDSISIKHLHKSQIGQGGNVFTPEVAKQFLDAVNDYISHGDMVVDFIAPEKARTVNRPDMNAMLFDLFEEIIKLRRN